MFFLRVDYIPSDSNSVHRVRGLYDSLEDCLKVLNQFVSSNTCVLLARCELCASKERLNHE